ncbi:MAG TPA: xanthine dehydrogenase family protein subunit M, partial [Gaiellaceae bacterium]
MIPTTFDYQRATSIDDALAKLQAASGGKFIAGGHSLVPLMKLRLSEPTVLIDVARIPGLAGIKEKDGKIEIGAGTTHRDVAASQLLRQVCPVVADTAIEIGDPQVRNRGTLGGSLAHADPAADYPTVVTALGATITAAGAGGSREIAADEFFQGIFETALQPGELLVSVAVPVQTSGTGGAYVKHRHPASRYAVAGAAAVVSIQGGSCTAARVAVGGVAANPVVVTAAGEALVGAAPSDEAIAAAAAHVADALGEPLSDTYASGEYRLHLAEVLAKRALAAAFERAG